MAYCLSCEIAINAANAGGKEAIFQPALPFVTNDRAPILLAQKK